MSISLRRIGRGNYSETLILHYSQRYLVFRDNQITCEPLKTADVDDFLYRLATYTASIIADDSPVTAQTVSFHQKSGSGLRIYLCATDKDSITFKEMDVPDSPQPVPQDNLIFFIRHGLQSGFVGYESIKYPMHYLAVEDDQVCLKELQDSSAAKMTPSVHFKDHIH